MTDGPAQSPEQAQEPEQQRVVLGTLDKHPRPLRSTMTMQQQQQQQPSSQDGHDKDHAWASQKKEQPNGTAAASSLNGASVSQSSSESGHGGARGDATQLAATQQQQQQQEQQGGQAQAASDVPRTRWAHLRHRASLYLSHEVSHEEALIPLSWQSFLCGAVSSIVYGDAGVWPVFMTGNLVQFSQNVAQYILPQGEAQRSALLTTLRLLAIAAFVLGSFVGAMIARRMGERRRAWLVLSSAIQAVLLWAAAAVVLARPKDEGPTLQWYPAMIIFTSASFGMQALTAQKLQSPAWATTVAYTATLTQIAADPFLGAIVPSRSTKGRDLRILSIAMLCFGAGVGECWLHSDLGFRGAMAVVAAFKVLLALLWLLPKGSGSSSS